MLKLQYLKTNIVEIIVSVQNVWNYYKYMFIYQSRAQMCKCKLMMIRFLIILFKT